MLLTLFSWLTILISALIFGYVLSQILYKKVVNWGNTSGFWTLDVYILSGLLFLTIYAEYFSIVYKVGILSCAILALLAVCAIIIYLKYMRENIIYRFWTYCRNISITTWVILISAVIVFIAWTCGSIDHPDTSLYHIQAIKWIENYGVVPGLGNLHNRFAYNSAFMCLQALFSFSWLLGLKSLHSVNGFICLFFFLYAILSFDYTKNKLELSDFFKGAIILFIALSTDYISSPGTDLFPMLIMLYICSKWCSVYEQNNNYNNSFQIDDSVYEYGYLCVVAVYALTLKLSVALFVLLAIYPLVIFIKKKQVRAIIFHALSGIIVLLPWIIRNVIISGYLIYPFPQIDIFNVDWKMPASVAKYDSMEITVWGRTTCDVTTIDDGLFSWIGHWVECNNGLLIWIAFASIAFILVYTVWSCITVFTNRDNRIYLVKNYSREHLWSLNSLIIVSMAAIMFWLISAPLYRYGMAYLLVAVSIAGYLLCKIAYGYMDCRKEESFHGIKLTIYLIILLNSGILIAKTGDVKNENLIYETEYAWYGSEHIEMANEISVWYPLDSVYCSNDVFPEATYTSMLEKIELRGNSLDDGFRMKQQYRNAKNLTEYGWEWTE